MISAHDIYALDNWVNGETLGLIQDGRLYLDYYEWAVREYEGMTGWPIVEIVIALPGMFSNLTAELCINLDMCKGKVRLEGDYYTVASRTVCGSPDGAYLRLTLD